MKRFLKFLPSLNRTKKHPSSRRILITLAIGKTAIGKAPAQAKFPHARYISSLFLSLILWYVTLMASVHAFKSRLRKLFNGMIWKVFLLFFICIKTRDVHLTFIAQAKDATNTGLPISENIASATINETDAETRITTNDVLCGQSKKGRWEERKQQWEMTARRR